jgi:hypothetical protein
VQSAIGHVRQRQAGQLALYHVQRRWQGHREELDPEEFWRLQVTYAMQRSARPSEPALALALLCALDLAQLITRDQYASVAGTRSPQSQLIRRLTPRPDQIPSTDPESLQQIPTNARVARGVTS